MHAHRQASVWPLNVTNDHRLGESDGCCRPPRMRAQWPRPRAAAPSGDRCDEERTEPGRSRVVSAPDDTDVLPHERGEATFRAYNREIMTLRGSIEPRNRVIVHSRLMVRDQDVRGF